MMVIFYVMFALLGFLFVFDEQKHRILICLLGFIILWIIQALRAPEVGVDAFYTYIPAFQDVGNYTIEKLLTNDVKYAFEPGYQLYMKLVRYFSSSPQFFLAVTSFIILAPIFYTIYKYSSNPAFSIVIFACLILYHFSFSGLRQAIAISICALSLKYVIERKILRFLVIILIAMTFHKSSIVFVPAYFLYLIKVNYKTIFFAFILIIISFLYVGPLVDLLRVLLFGTTKFSSYVSGGVGAMGLTILYGLISLFILLFTNKNNPHRNIYVWFSLVVLLIQSLTFISNAADRIAYYYMFLYCLAIPAVVNELSLFNNSVKKLLVFLMCIFLMMFFIYYNSGGYLNVVPYKFYWMQ